MQKPPPVSQPAVGLVAPELSFSLVSVVVGDPSGGCIINDTLRLQLVTFQLLWGSFICCLRVSQSLEGGGGVCPSCLLKRSRISESCR